jgi:hypothetical protein
VRGLGAHIKGTNGESQGVVPFLKVANDTAIAVNQGGKRKGAVCAYLETWHVDIEEFLDLRKNIGDDRRRTHDMNTANWIPDLFLQRVQAGADWTLFSPDEVPDLHDLYGKPFNAAYEASEAKAARGEIKVFRTVKAVDLWRRMLTMLIETGHPWITFKGPCNLRSPQRHTGVIHSSNLCTEITLNTSVDEVAVCNLGSVNLAAHVTAKGLDVSKLERTVKTAMRMLDNVIDINFYTIPEGAVPIFVIGRSALASWAIRMRWRRCVCLSPLRARSPSPTNPWRLLAILRSRHQLISRPSEDAMRRLKARCGRRACCRSTVSTLSRRLVMERRSWTVLRRSAGQPCATA